MCYANVKLHVAITRLPGNAVSVLLLTILGGVYWLHSNLDHLVKSGIGSYGSAMTGATMTVERVEIKPTDGRGTLSGLLIGKAKWYPPGRAHPKQPGPSTPWVGHGGASSNLDTNQRSMVILNAARRA